MTTEYINIFSTAPAAPAKPSQAGIVAGALKELRRYLGTSPAGRCPSCRGSVTAGTAFTHARDCTHLHRDVVESGLTVAR